MSDEVYVGRTCLYKDGESRIFEGAEVAKALAKGWKDSPRTELADEPDAEEEDSASDED